MTQAMKPRPVWARYLRRKNGEQVGYPTDEEKHDAILVLGSQPYTPVDLLTVEAVRIWEDGSC